MPLLLASFPAVRYGGWLRPIVVSGPSMAEALFGEHVLLTCPGCGFGWRCDARYLPDDLLVCPNCGGRHRQQPATVRVQSGQRVLLDRWAPPRRWDTVAFADRTRGFHEVKRLAGLPGEAVAIAQGDLWINGQRCQKSLDEFRRLAVLIHDSRYFDPGLPPRWRPATAVDSDARWTSHAGGWSLAPCQRAAAMAWLEYQPVAGYERSTSDAPVWAWVDAYPANASLSRQLHQVRDVVLQLDLETGRDAELTLSLTNCAGHLRLTCTGAKGWVSGSWNGVDLPGNPPLGGSRALPHPAGRSPASGRATTRPAARSLWWGVLDGRALLVSGEQCWTALLPPTDSPPSTITGAPLALGARGGTLTLRRIRIWRDLHYAPLSPGVAWSLALGADELAVLGDNQPVSEDSRRWGPLPAQCLKGCVLPWPFAVGDRSTAAIGVSQQPK